uniref:2-C-methyl-D-erythritol 4-phosphate cytidylyltransferase, chloroplastic n=1 Tax=Trieres chinensis TaxID=1514140 RepID=A0A7S1YUW1_TRICV|mmetsp:Transcript_11265/g.23598  ORF Transcript_11265/g.23598 Transcript_11265/m.23598 type:complete len:328 (+) Transcript_11265:94-1077(+)
MMTPSSSLLVVLACGLAAAVESFAPGGVGGVVASSPGGCFGLVPSVRAATVAASSSSSSSSSSSLRMSEDGASSPAVDFSDVGFVLLAGGTGSRMKANMPKQFMTLKGRPVLHHSLDLFLERLPEYAEGRGVSGPPLVVLVMDPKYQPEYQPIIDNYPDRLAFANPGEERQGSVENGLNKLAELAGDKCAYVAVHDSARPLVTVEEVCDVVRDAKECGAAVLGVPCKATIKESDDGETVLRTIPRARLWEVHTPQVIKISTLLKGFERVAEEGWEVTDDVSIVEAMGEKVKLTRGEYTNLKITTPEDMDVASAILEDRKDVKVTELV